MRPPLARTYHELLDERAREHPAGLAVIDRGVHHSWAALSRRSEAVAGALRALGIGRGDRIAALLPNRIEFLDLLFAAGRIGAVLVPFSTWSTSRELDVLLEDSRPRAVISIGGLGDRDLLEEISALIHPRGRHTPEILAVVDGTAPPGAARFVDWLAQPPLAPLAPGDAACAADTALVLYTSGSSSHPKAVPMRHHAAIENGFNIGERQGYGPTDRVLLSVPLFWSYAAVNAVPAALSHGAALVLQERFDAEGALALIEDHACTAIYTLPAITSALLAAPGFHPQRTRSLRTGLTIGSPQDVTRAATELGARAICNVYGSTETYGNCCVTPHHWPLERRARCQGPPLPGVRLRTRDPDTAEPCVAGEVGELSVLGPLTPGYEGASATENAGSFDADGWFRTGDLVALDHEGCIVFAGRSHEMIKRSGINVSPSEVEEVLQQHDGVGLAGVTGASDPVLGERIVAFVVRRPAATVEVEELRAHCRERLSRYKLPDVIAFRDGLPLTPTGKIMRRQLAALAADTED